MLYLDAHLHCLRQINHVIVVNWFTNSTLNCLFEQRNGWNYGKLQGKSIVHTFQNICNWNTGFDFIMKLSLRAFYTKMSQKEPQNLNVTAQWPNCLSYTLKTRLHLISTQCTWLPCTWYWQNVVFFLVSHCFAMFDFHKSDKQTEMVELKQQQLVRAHSQPLKIDKDFCLILCLNLNSLRSSWTRQSDCWWHRDICTWIPMDGWIVS